MLGHQSISNSQSRHGLDDGYRPRHHAGIVSSLGSKDALLRTVVRGCRLILADCRGRLEADAEVHWHAVGDAALNATRVIRAGGQYGAGDAAGLVVDIDLGGGDEGVVVLAAIQAGGSEAAANLEAICRRNRHHGLGECGLKLIEAGFAKADGNVADNAGDGSANAVELVAGLADVIFHLTGDVGVWAAHWEEFVDTVARHRADEVGKFRAIADELTVNVGKEMNPADTRNKCDDLHSVSLVKPFLRDSSSRDTRNRFPGGASSSTGRGLDPILGEVRPVGMARARVEIDSLTAVVTRSLVFVGDDQENGRSEGATGFDARVNSDAVFFVTRSRDGRLAWSAAVELRLDIRFGEGEAWRAVFDNATHGFAMGFSRCVHEEEASEGRHSRKAASEMAEAV